MKALDRKLLRDLRLMWSQVLTIALVVGSGIGGFITTLSAVDSLALARDLLRDPWIMVTGICWVGFFVLSRFWNQLS